MPEKAKTLQDYDWVNARGECSPFIVFTTLRGQAESDVEKRNALREKRQETNLVALNITPSPDRFIVHREQVGRAASLQFSWTKTGIEVRDDDGKVILEGILTLNDDAECRLRVGKDELTFWQFRRRALEALFFN